MTPEALAEGKRLHGEMVRLVTLGHYEGGPAVAAAIADLDPATLRGVAEMLAGAVAAANEMIAEQRGVPLDKFLRTWALTAQRAR